MKCIKEYITNEYLSKLDCLNISIENIVDNFYAGTNMSNKNGISLEFSDFKQYTIGDDIRSIDWNSYARTEKLYIKRFKEEKQLAVNIFIDSSKSMDYGYENKAYYAKLMVASISYIALKNSQSVNIFVCNKNFKIKKVCVKTKNLFMRIIDFLDNIHFEHEINLSQSILEISKSYITQGFSFILSDFFSKDGYKNGIKALKYKKQEIILLHILSPQELFPEIRGNFKLIDSETKEFCEIEINEYAIQQYIIELNKFQNEIKEFCITTGILYNIVSTNISIIEKLGNLNI